MFILLKKVLRVENGSTGRIDPDGSTVDYGGELSINSANIYGEKGIIADGRCTCLHCRTNFAYAGTGKRSVTMTQVLLQKNLRLQN